MKKLLTVGSLVGVLALAACGGTEDEGTETEETGTEGTETETDTDSTESKDDGA